MAGPIRFVSPRVSRVPLSSIQKWRYSRKLAQFNGGKIQKSSNVPANFSWRYENTAMKQRVTHDRHVIATVEGSSAESIRDAVDLGASDMSVAKKRGLARCLQYGPLLGGGTGQRPVLMRTCRQI